MKKIVLAGVYPEHTYEKLRAALPEEEFQLEAADTQEKFDAVTDAEILVLRIFKAPEEVMERNPRLKMIMRWGAGVDSVDLQAAGKRGIFVTNTPGANAGAVSELAVMLMLAVGRKLLCHQVSMREGIWSKNRYLDQSFTLAHKTVGILGAGNIGRQVALKAQAFGAVTQYYDIYRLEAKTEEAFHLSYVPLETLLRTSDLVSIHIPLTEETRHLVGEREIGMMKEGAILINTSRGGLVDDHALYEAVAAGRLAGAGLDVVEEEPLLPGHELLNNPNIVVTPHIGGGTADLGDEIIPMLTADIFAYAAGKEPAHVANRSFLKQGAAACPADA